MAKNIKKRAVVYSNVKENKKKLDEDFKIKQNLINLDNEVVIGMSKTPNNKPIKNKNNKPVKKNKPVKSNKKVNKNKSSQNKTKKTINPQKRKRALKILKIFFLIIFLIVGLIVLLRSSLFNITQINVTIQNNKVLTESQIKSLSSVNIGQNIYSINKNEIINNIKSEPYVESVKITRSLPNVLKIEVEERSVKFILDYNGQYIYVDNQGYILEKSSNLNDEILITGYSTTELEDGNRLNSEDLEKLSAVLKIMQEAENNDIKNDITKIDIEDKNDYKIYFDNLGKIAHLGDTTSINDKMTYIKKILEVESNYEGEIFVNVNLNNGEYPYFREKV